VKGNWRKAFDIISDGMTEFAIIYYFSAQKIEITNLRLS
jgi:hypothetical protein